MTITNKTLSRLEISSGNGMRSTTQGKLAPNETGDFPEMAFNTLNVHSEIGHCVVTTEYSKRSIRNSGLLVATEDSKKDENGMKNIIISILA